MTIKTKTPHVLALLAIAAVNLATLVTSGRLQEMRDVDALRLLLSGILLGIVIGQLRFTRTA